MRRRNGGGLHNTEASTIHGAGKLDCECLGRCYKDRFALGYPAVRFPSVIGSDTTQCAVTQYNSRLIAYPARGKSFECFVTLEIEGPGVCFKAACRGTIAERGSANRTDSDPGLQCRRTIAGG